MNGALHGAGIVVARAEGRGEGLRQRIEQTGGEALLLPVVAIAPLSPALPQSSPQWLVFTSPAAVEHGLPTLRERINERTRIAVVGPGTARALEAEGIVVDALPARHESEGLLALGAFDVRTGERCWIVRGRDGRELLSETLCARGVDVAFVEVYERRLPALDLSPLLQRWRTRRVDALIAASAACLSNLHALLDAEGRRFLGETQLVIPTERMLKLALELDIRPAPLVAAGASDDALLATLTRWWHARRQDSR